MKATKTVFSIVLLSLMALISVAMVAAVPATIDWVKIDGDEIEPNDNNRLVLEKDNELEVKLQITATDDLKDAQVEVVMRGYDHDDLIEDISDVFDLRANNSKKLEFTLKFPWKLDKDSYKLRVRVDDRDGSTTEQTYNIEVESQRHDVKITDVIFSPSNHVVAGRSLLTTLRIENIGMLDEEGVKAKISIPALGISAADYIDEVEEDDSVSSEELWLVIPPCTKGGNYEATVSIQYDDGDEVASVKQTVTVVEDETCKEQQAPEQTTPKTIITVGPTTQDVAQGQGGVIYPLTLSNAGSESRTYVITADGYSNWADVRISPANIVTVAPGEAKALYVYVSAKEDAPVGEHMFSLTVTSGAETLRQFTLKANVVAGDDSAQGWDSLKKGLLIGLVVLVVLLVILGLIIGFSKLKGNDDRFDDEEEKGSQTYY